MKKKYGLLAFAVMMMFAGVYHHEAKIVLSKGVRICLECIGIG
ncbi:CD1871A family CXXC motif-containing protein [Vallitalea pronyensis]|nr:CD1871A family CXXC motif-containing protein [Vallitalea pronyensis]